MSANQYPELFSDREWIAIEKKLNQPPEQTWRDMIAAGLIDEEGNVLIRMPIFEPGEQLEPVVEDLERDWAGEYHAERARRRGLAQ